MYSQNRKRFRAGFVRPKFFETVFTALSKDGHHVRSGIRVVTPYRRVDDGINVMASHPSPRIHAAHARGTVGGGSDSVASDSVLNHLFDFFIPPPMAKTARTPTRF